MASGRLGSAGLPAATNTLIYTVPAGKTSVVTINACNTSAVSAAVRIAVSTSGTPVSGEWIEYGANLPSGGVLERGGVVLAAGQTVVGYATAAGVDFNVWGYEE